MRIFFVFILSSAFQASAQAPDGLCAIFGKFGRGSGFVVGDKFFTAAHVIEKLDKTTRIRCMQDGQFVDLTHLMTGKPEVHPFYLDTSDALKGVIHQRHSAKALKMLHDMAATPYDVGYIRLSKPIKTKFIIDSSKSISGTVDLLAKIGVSDDFYFGASVGPATFAHSVRTQRLSNDVVGADWEFNDEVQKFEVHGRSSGVNGNAYLQPHHETGPGDSGGPLYYLSKGGDFIVVGVVFGRIAQEIKLVDEIPPTMPGFFLPSKNIVSWLHSDAPHLFSKECEMDLHSENNARQKNNL